MGSAYQDLEKDQRSIAGIADAGNIQSSGNGSGFAAEARREGQSNCLMAQKAHKSLVNSIESFRQWWSTGWSFNNNDNHAKYENDEAT